MMNVDILLNNRLDRALAERAKAGKTGLIVYITAGFPDLPTTHRLLPALFEAGADVVEIGMPFSDPLADGPTIQRASQQALANGVRLADVLQLIQEHRRRGLAGSCVLLSYANPLLANGILTDPSPLAGAGFDGVIIPDMPAVESTGLEQRCRGVGIYLIPFLTPTSPLEQIKRVAGGSGGFVYCVSVTGVTGSRESLPDSTIKLLDTARAVANRPLALGFGISGPVQAARLSRHCDAIIVGSALTERITQAEDPVAAAVAFVRELRQAIGE